MQYLSTRGDSKRLSFEEAVLQGLGKDGGLMIPASLPRLPRDWKDAWADMSFEQLAYEIMSRFIASDEVPSQDLKQLIANSYGTFRAPNVTPLHKLDDKKFVLELFHGPTFAFKDVALQFLGNLFEYFLKRKNHGKAPSERQRITVVGATSGDTGSAAIYGVRNKQDISIFILYPEGRVSPIQEAQMTTLPDANVFNLAVKGTFDDCQSIVKTLFSDTEFNTRHSLGAVNSINWARILAQITYYFHSYFALRKLYPDQPDLKVQYVVPTGNFGDILAGWYAKRLGLPMAELVIATNENDILQRFLATGHYTKASSSETQSSSQVTTAETEKVAGSTDGQQPSSGGAVKATLAPAMDILLSSNFERLLWYYAFEHLTSTAHIDEWGDGDVSPAAKRVAMAGSIVKQWMEDLKSKNQVVVGMDVWEAAKREFQAERVSDEQIIETIRKVYVESNYVVDPHTAIGVAAASRLPPSDPNVIQVSLATAHPAKFSEAVEKALSSQPGFSFETQVLPPEFKGLLQLEKRIITVNSIKEDETKKVIEAKLAELFGSAETGGDENVSV